MNLCGQKIKVILLSQSLRTLFFIRLYKVNMTNIRSSFIKIKFKRWQWYGDCCHCQKGSC